VNQQPEASNQQFEPLAPPPLVDGDSNPRRLDDVVCLPAESFPTVRWWVAISFTGAFAILFAVCFCLTIYGGIGRWGLNIPVAWAFDITNFVFWIGIGHAGTLISAILFLFRQRWRTGISRFAEAMTIFAVICAAMFPLLHTGRPWLAWYWLVPLPTHNHVWVNFRSPLCWDLFAVGTYFTVSLLFWWTGLLPDLATLRDRATHPLRKLLYGLPSLGWNGSARAWNHYEAAYLLLAGLATPLVLSVHSIVSFDFAVSILPGWHSTIFPPYFVAGAIFSGFAMVCVSLLFLRRVFRLEHVVTIHHLDLMNRVTLATGLMVSYSYAIECFLAWYSGSLYEKYSLLNRAFGDYSWCYWLMISGNVLLPQLFWIRKVRRSPWLMFPVVFMVLVAMWFERFVIIVVSLHRDFLPSSWGYYSPTWVEYGLLAGSFGVFSTFVLLFCRFAPTIALSELKNALRQGETVALPGDESVATAGGEK
jgi:Ni/Fe-hydrogenase subunit HybB-like protein